MRTRDKSEGQDRILIALHGRVVSRCYLDSAFGLQFFGSGEDVTIRIEGTFLLAIDGVRHHLSPRRPEELGPAIALYGKEVAFAEASEDGRLLLGFQDGARLGVPADPLYEAWEIVGPGRTLIVSLPGGRIARWTS